jgi:hypothetical protein
MSISFEPQIARADAVEYFRTILKDRVVQVFQDVQTGLQLGVFVPSPTIERKLGGFTIELSPPRVSPRASPRASLDDLDDSVSSSQQYGPVDELDLISAEKTAGVVTSSRADAEAADQRDIEGTELTYVVSNKNRTRMRKVRANQLKALQAKQRLRKERSARRVIDSESDVDEPAEPVAHEWFRGKRDPDGRPISFQLQKSMERNARAIAGTGCAADWQELYKHWQAGGQLISRPSTSTPSSQNYGPEIQAFCQAYAEVEAVRTADSIRSMAYRFRMVALHRLYCAIPDVDLPQTTSSVTLSSLRRKYLFGLLNPNLAPSAATHKFKQLSRDLDNAKRWSRLEAMLGAGFFGLIPSQIVSHHWIERGLTVGQFAVWIEAIEYYQPTIVQISARWLATILRARQGIGFAKGRLLEETPASLGGRSGQEHVAATTEPAADLARVDIVDRETPDFLAAVQSLHSYECEAPVDSNMFMWSADLALDFLGQLDPVESGSDSP